MNTVRRATIATVMTGTVVATTATEGTTVPERIVIVLTVVIAQGPHAVTTMTGEGLLPLSASTMTGSLQGTMITGGPVMMTAESLTILNDVGMIAAAEDATTKTTATMIDPRVLQMEMEDGVVEE